MRIISKFHDYYDTAMGFGQDPQLIYHRKSELIQIKKWRWDRKIDDLLLCEPSYYLYSMPLAALGFCGRCYPNEPIAPDELITQSKGFDEQSFRTAAPGQKKLNRKANKQAKRQKRESDSE